VGQTHDGPLVGARAADDLALLAGGEYGTARDEKLWGGIAYVKAAV
jgi:hypothetical protein